MRGMRSEDGQATVELALVIPILLIVLIGIIDFGRAINYWNDENQLAESAARFAAVNALPTSGSCGTSAQGTGETIAQYVVCEAKLDSPELASGSRSSYGVAGSGVAVSVCAPSNTQGNEVTVQVSADYNWLPFPKFLGGSLNLTRTTLTGQAQMRLETTVNPAWLTGTCS